MLALAAVLALAQDTAVTLTLDRTVVAEGQKATFTIKTTDAWQPGRWRLLGFFSGKDQAIKFDADPHAPETTPVIARAHVGQTFTLCLGVFEYGSPSWQAETDHVETRINLKLQERKLLSDQLADHIDQVHQADDEALQALRDARSQARAIVEAGEPGAEAAAEAALEAGWAAADAAWAGAQSALDQWQSLLDGIAQVEAEIVLVIEAGRTYYANMVLADTQAVELNFLDEETATAKAAHKVRRELLMVRPLGASSRVDVDALPAGRVQVSKKSVAQRANNKADMVVLELRGLAEISGAVKDVEIRALVGGEKIKSMPHTNVEYRNLRLTRQHEQDDSLDDFAYDDAKTVVPADHLVVYLRGTIFPAVSRAVAAKNLVDHLRVDIPVVDDSHGAMARVKPAPRRPLKKTDKKFATIEFGEKKPTPVTTADKIQLAAYDGEASGAFLTLFAYNGLPGTAKDNFGKKTLKIRGVSIDDETVELASFDVRYFFTFRKTNHPNMGPAQADDSVNGVWYYSAEGAGAADAQAVPGWSWANAQVGESAYSVLPGYVKDGESGTLGETTATPKTLRLYGFAIAAKSCETGGFHYSYDQTTWAQSLNELGQPVRKRITLTIVVQEKRFADLVAHVWRHELRHAEQIERLSRRDPADTIDQDGDRIYNWLEVRNNTDISKDATWKGFPVSTSSAKHDQEVDCELRSVDVRGVPANDWAMDLRTDGKGRKQKTTRLGLQWKE